MRISLKSLSNQVIVITGASSGIGLVTARMAAKKGARLVLAARNTDALRELTEEINSQGGKATFVTADVGKEQDVTKIAEKAIEEYGGFDTWVNNAGIGVIGRAYEVSIEDFKKQFDTNFWGTVYGSNAAVKHFKEKGTSGSLVNIGSIAGDHSGTMLSTYGVTKHAIHGWTESLRTDLEGDKLPISVSLIHPARIDTPYNDHAHCYLKEYPAHHGIIYPPKSVAEAILYCAENQRRDMFIGFHAKAYSIFPKLFPRLMDMIMIYVMRNAQTDPSRRAKSFDQSALYKPGFGMHENGTHIGYHASTSLFTKACMHPYLLRIGTVFSFLLLILYFTGKNPLRGTL